MRFITLLILAFNLQISASPQNQVANGYLTYGKEVFKSLQINGYVTLNGTTVLELLQVNGSATATKAKLGEVQVNGQALFSHCTVKDKCTVRGSISAFSSTFENPILLTTDHSVFDSCSVMSVNVLKGKDNITQTIDLKGKTKVMGQISFESGSGQVNAGPDCQITDASVIGGKLMKR